jgi:hypothetical protein
MDIYSPSGTKVVFLGKNGHDRDLKEANEAFSVGQILTVFYIDVDSWSSFVEFEECPGEYFNTVMFGKYTE